MRLWAILIFLGFGWGLTLPLTKIAVGGGYRDFGMIFWQSVVMITILGTVALVRRKGLVFGRPQIVVYVMIALVGTVLPNAASFTAYIHLDAGIMAILISLVPIFALPVALALGLERLQVKRLVGLVIGLIGVMLLILPGQSAIGAVGWWWIPIGLIPSVLYAFEGNLVSRFGMAGLDALQAIFGASIVALIVSAPMVLITDSWINPLPPYGAPDLALVMSSAIHAFVYAGYVWLVGAAGSVFAVQVGYIVTLSGVLWARIVLGESYSPWVWLALLCVMAGVFLVQPKPVLRVAPEPDGGQD
jgi:drug/metabolite transporter (DMT)-like permease